MLQWVINIVLIYIIARYTNAWIFATIVHRYKTIMLILLCFISNYHRTLLYHKYLTCSFVVFSAQLFHSRQRKIQSSIFYHQQRWFLLSKPSDHWNTEHYSRSVNHGEGYIESDINRLVSGNFWQYTRVPSQFERLPWIWTWRLLYFDGWYHLEKRPCSV